MPKPVFLIPGFTASDLVILASGNQIWFSTQGAALTGLGAMRLAPDGVSPGPPDGQRLGVVTSPNQNPWDLIVNILTLQLGFDGWGVQVISYDWRLELETIATALAANIRSAIVPSNPCTLVAHSAGGLVAVLAWAQLLASGDQAKVRRIITIGTPFLGSYGSLQWIAGQNATVKQLFGYASAVTMVTGFNPAKWTLNFLTALALTWPSFYELFPALDASDLVIDPFRPLLYTAGNYAGIAAPAQSWLDHAGTFQSAISAAAASVPYWVLTTVAAQGISTPYKLLSDQVRPLNLKSLGMTQDGDGVVTAASATIGRGLNVYVNGAHPSLPLGLAINGTLKELIIDPRGPITPPVPPIKKFAPISENVSVPPEASSVSGLVCLGGG